MNRTTSSGTRQSLRALAVALFLSLAVAAMPAVSAPGNGKGSGQEKGGGGGGGTVKGPGKGGSRKGGCDPSPAAPVIEGLPTFSLIEGDSYAFTPKATDANCDALTFSVSGKPSWASFDPSRGTLSGRPPVGSAGSYPNVLVSVTDGTFDALLPAFTITVYANTPPMLIGTPPGRVVSGTPYEFVPTASDPDGQPLRFAIARKPAWASFDSASGRLSGTPARTDAGTFDGIVISVSDGLASTATGAFAITVEAANAAPVITGTAPGSVTAGQAYSFTPSASDPDNDTLRFSVQNRPSWAAFDTLTGRLSGTPARADSGSYSNIVIQVSDGSLAASLPAFGIVVQDANRAPTISGSPPRSVLAGKPYLFTPSASDPDGDPLSFEIVNAPRWVAFDARTGSISGSPQAADIGEYVDISVRVSDGQAQSSLGPFAIVVEQVVTGSATLSWQPPAERTDGSSLTDLKGYRILYGASPNNLSESVTLDNPGLTSYVVGNLTQGTWYFRMTAYDSRGMESSPTNAVSKTVQ